jgi:hypothetical protein
LHGGSVLVGQAGIQLVVFAASHHATTIEISISPARVLGYALLFLPGEIEIRGPGAITVKLLCHQ